MNDERERDPRGRPQNARPRDGLGRPLARGQSGVPRVPETLLLDPADSLVEAQRLLDTGMPFHAHEVLEAAWKTAPVEQRDLWQGLAQLAVGMTHALRGNRTGAAALLTRGRDRIQPYRADPPYSIDVAGLIDWADAAGSRLRDLPGASDGVAHGIAEFPTTPQLVRSPA